MKIQSQFIKFNSSNIKKEDNKRVENSKNKSEINKSFFDKNTPSEVLGRSQLLSFKGINSFKNNKFTYENTTKTGFLGGRVDEKIEYDSKTGEFVFQKIINGQVQRKERYNPQEQSSYVFEVDNSGYETETIKTPDETHKVVCDNLGREVLSEKSDNNGNFEKIKTEYDIGRKIVETLKKGQEEIHVFDLNNGKEVFDGKLVEVVSYDEKSGLYLTHNILTKVLLKEENIDKEKNIKTVIEYDKNTGLKSQKTVYTKGTTRQIKYSEDGKTITSDIEKRKKQDGTILTLNYSPVNQNELMSMVVERTDKTKDILFYEQGKIRTKEHYKDRKLIYSEERINDGNTVKSRTHYLDDGRQRIEEFSEINPRIRTHSILKDANNRMIQMQIYNSTGEYIEKERNYNFDMSYTELTFNEYGEVISQQDYTKDGKAKIFNGNTESRHRKFYEFSDINFFDDDYDSASEKPVELNKEEVLSRISEKAKLNKGLTTFDYSELADVLGLKDIDLEQADGTEIKKLIKQYHTDVNQNDEYAKTITQILLYIYNSVK